MIWEVEDIKEELVTLERRVKSLPKNGQSRGEGIFFIRPGSRLVQQQGRTDVAEVVQHSSLLEHNGNVTALSLIGLDTLVSGSRDRTINIHQFTGKKKRKLKERKSYL